MSTLFSFRGRLGQAPFWKALLGLLAVCVLACLVFDGAVGALVVLAAAWPLLAISVKRLRDINRAPVFVLMPLGASAAVWVLGGGLLTFGFIASAILMVPHLFAEILEVSADFLSWLSLAPPLIFWLWLGLRRSAGAAAA